MDQPVKPQARPAAVAFVFAVVLIDVIALGIIIPVLPKLVEDMLGGDTPRAAEIYGLFGTAWALMQFLASPVLGALSDRFGRRPVLLVSMVGHGLDYILMALAPTLWWLFLGRVLSGITAASFSTAYAYIADVTAPERRAKQFGLIGAAFGIGFVLGPALGGVLGAIDPRLPFWAAAAFSLANALYGWLVLPESLPPEKRSAFRWKGANPVGALQLMRTSATLLGLAGVAFLYQLAHAALPAVAVLYCTYRYGWDTQMVGLSLAAVGIASGIVQAGLVQSFIGWIGERGTFLLGLACGVAGFATYGFAPTGAWFFAGIPLMGLWGLGGASSQALMSRLVGPQAQGQLQGANASIMGLAGLIGPGLFTLTFAAAIRPDAAWHLPGAPFLLAALLMAAALALGWWVTRASGVRPAGSRHDGAIP
ncbi:MAG: TCR/Tet family MFS transporter [Hyphomicrobiaceae bacterium]|nr:TCR/Tet family MFS transporter [Hyphomicrobiaceae bacterium]